MREEGKDPPPLGSAPPDFHLTGSRDLNMDNPGDGASLQFGRFAVGSSYQQSEHIVLWKCLQINTCPFFFQEKK